MITFFVERGAGIQAMTPEQYKKYTETLRKKKQQWENTDTQEPIEALDIRIVNRSKARDTSSIE